MLHGDRMTDLAEELPPGRRSPRRPKLPSASVQLNGSSPNVSGR